MSHIVLSGPITPATMQTGTSPSKAINHKPENVESLERINNKLIKKDNKCITKQLKIMQVEYL